MVLTTAQLAQREGRITASFMPALMAGDNERIHDEWLRLIGDPKWAPPDFSHNWPVKLGEFIETFCIDWHERKSQRELTRRGEVVQHPQRAHVCATLDSFCAASNCVIDCKVSTGWRPIDEIVAYYTPQLIVQRACVQCDNAALLLCHGGVEPTEIEIHIDPDYERTLFQRLDQFWQCVLDLTPPVALPVLPPPEKWRTINLDTDAVNWAPLMMERLTRWNDSKDAADVNAEAAKLVKELLPDDVGKLTWGALAVTRNRARAVSIKRAK